MKKLFLILFLTLACVALTSAQDEGLVVNANNVLFEINPYVYGANYGPPTLVGLDLAEQAKDSGVTLWRMPAGHWGDVNDFRPEQIDLYYNQSQQWGMDLLISVRMLGSGGTVEKAAEMVQYTVDKGYDVKYWSIGNEVDILEPYVGENLADFSQFDMEGYNEDWRVTAEAMLAVKSDIIFVGPDVSQFPSSIENPDVYRNMRLEILREFLKANGDLIGIVSVHRYPFPNSRTESTPVEDLRNNPPEWEILVDILRQAVDEILGADVPIAITEANSHWSNSVGGQTTPDSFYNAIWWADVLGRLITKKVDMVTIFAFQTSTAVGGFGILEKYDPRPTYYTYLLYKQFGSQLVESDSGEQHVRVYAALRDDGALTLLLINLGDEEVTRPVTIEGFTPAGMADVWLFDAEHKAEQLDPVDISGGVTLPGQSVSVYVLNAG